MSVLGVATSLLRSAAAALYLATFAVELLLLDRPAVGHRTLGGEAPGEAPRPEVEPAEGSPGETSAEGTASARNQGKYSGRFFRHQSFALVPVVEAPDEEAERSDHLEEPWAILLFML